MHWHFFQMSVSNVVVIVLMLVVFVAAILLPFPAHRATRGIVVSVSEERSWTAACAERAVAALPPDKLLPDKQPSYVASWIYVFGVLSLASLA